MAREMTAASELHSRISEIHKFCFDDDGDQLNPSDGNDSFRDSAIHLQSTVPRIVSEFSDLDSLGIQDLDAYIEHLEKELHRVETENTHVANEIELLSKTHKDDSILLKANLEELKCSLDSITSKEQKTAKANEGIDSPMLQDDCSNLSFEKVGENLEQLELDNKVHEMKSILKSLEYLQCKVKWLDAVEQTEDALTGLKVLAFDDNCIRLSLQTYMPTVEGISYLERVEDTTNVSKLNHELLIEVFEGTLKLKNVQVFPNDIFVNDIVDTANTVSKSPLQWLIQKLQDRIILTTLRSVVVKDANKSRYSLEYLDKDETIVAHLVRGIDVYIKLSHGWPICGSPLKLISIKGLDISKRTCPSFHCKVDNLANSLDTHIRQNLSSFVDAVEKVIEQLQSDPRADDGSG